MRICSVENCGKKYYAKDLCANHYSSNYKKTIVDFKEREKRYNKTHYHKYKKQISEERKANREKYLERERIYIKNNPEKLKLKNKRWTENNPNYQKEWRENNRDKRSAAELKRRSRKIGNGVFEIKYYEISKIYNSSCYFCGSKEKIQIDHIIPISKGGRHSIGNLQPLCQKCNVRKGNSFMVEFKYKYKGSV